MSRAVNLTVPPSCHHQSGIRIASAPRPRATDTSTAENEPSEYFWATTDPPHTTAVVTSAAYAAISEGLFISDKWVAPSGTLAEHRATSLIDSRPAPVSAR